jgi:DNA adenine methylase
VRELIRSIAVFKAIDPSTLLLFLHDSIIDKFRRIKRIVAREQRTFDHPALQDHIETALRSGFYMYMRQVMNQRKYVLQHPQTHTAIWYFVRELCYGSMFRFNAKGEFNIPYGGIAYNRKNLRAKVQALFQDSVEQLFGRSQIFNLDFEEFLTKTKATESDFIFLDPPYDSEFSEYDRNAFTRQDQLRLRDCLHRQTAKWMMVIKETTFIRNIYKEIDANFIDFDKTYMYNVRGRNNRDTKHLIITNYLPHNISK